MSHVSASVVEKVPTVVPGVTFSFREEFESDISVGILLDEAGVAIVKFSPVSKSTPVICHIFPVVFVIADGVSSEKSLSLSLSYTK